MRVKICGIRRPEWAKAAADAGADAVGLVFADSPRRVSLDEARRIVQALPPWVTPVGVFVDEAPTTVRYTARDVGLAAVQLHGDEPPEMLTELGRLKVVKVFRLGSEADVEAARAWRARCERAGRLPDAYLVDARVPGGPKGGTGQAADWNLARHLADEGFRPLVLSGGLSPENVAEAIEQVQPWGVDTSSGTESAPGHKDPEKIRAFLETVRRAEN
ncbi:MAG: phosphoribosylanthranilate isomerase [Phycisphaerae bacterium]